MLKISRKNLVFVNENRMILPLNEIKTKKIKSVKIFYVTQKMVVKTLKITDKGGMNLYNETDTDFAKINFSEKAQFDKIKNKDFLKDSIWGRDLEISDLRYELNFNIKNLHKIDWTDN